jgi:transcriptional regulator with PAS, ATPase and Fis domain
MALNLETTAVYGISKSFLSVVEQADEYARSRWPILICGETGVGKEVLARRIHFSSGRSAKAFLPLNCAAMPPGLLESELFGHERGAFSGAVQSSRGIARSADGGTLLLDEVGDLDASGQVKLLRLLDSGEVRSVGGTRVDHVDTRLIAATNVELEQAVRRGRFRLDLLERLSVLTLRIPPLRERPDDIPIIARELLRDFGFTYAGSVLEQLRQYDWPGNVRQLKNVLIRAGVLGHRELNGEIVDRILVEEHTRHSIALSGEPASLADVERQVVLERLQRNGGNRKQTAKDLGIGKSTLHEKLKRWKLDWHEPKPNTPGNPGVLSLRIEPRC